MIIDPHPVQFGENAGANYSHGVLNSVYSRNFVTVKSGNGDFPDAIAGVYKLDNDVCIKIEIVGIVLEWDSFQGRDAVSAVAGMEFRKVGLHDAILDESKDLVADPLV